MKKRKSNYTKDEKIIEYNLEDVTENTDCQRELDKQSYQKYLRKSNAEELNYKNFEVIFTDKLDRKAMKSLSDIERFTIYVCTFKKEYLEMLCEDFQLSKKGFIKIRNQGIEKFKKNRNKYANEYKKRKRKRKNKKYSNKYKKQKPYSNKKGGGLNG